MFYRKIDPLDDELFAWATGDWCRVRDLLRSGCVFGQTGSGKSSGGGRMVACALARYRNSSGLILASKPEDKAWWQDIFAREGRKDDLIVLEPGGKHRLNVFDFEMKQGADTRDLTQFMMTMAETVNRSTSGQSRDPFWIEQNRRQIHNAIEVVKTATGKLDPWDLHLFLDGAANSPAELATDEWKAGFHYKTLQAAYANATGEIAQHDNRLARQYFCSELVRLNERTRSSIAAGVMGLLHIYNTGMVRHLLATDTTVSPAIMEDRKWLMVNMPIVAGDATSTVVNASVKFVYQRAIQRRKVGPRDPIVCIYADEFPKVVNSYDTAFLAECRSHKGCMFTLAQSLPGLIQAMGGDKHAAAALLCNQYLKLFHLAGDPDTAAYGSALLGQQRETSIGGSEPAGRSLADELFGPSALTASFNESYQPVLQPAAFLGGLRTGGRENGNVVDGILIRQGTYRYVSFKQG
jgi:hypothetical protein